MRFRGVILCILASWLGLAGCTERVNLQNQSGEAMSNGQIQAGRKTIWSGDLAAGEQIQVRFSASGDGSFSVGGQLASGKTVSAHGLGYVTPHAGQNHQLIVEPNGQVRYQRVK